MPAALPVARVAVAVLLAACPEPASARLRYQTKRCSESRAEALSSWAREPGAAACPYDFTKPACRTAEPQAPRDLTAGAAGQKTPKAVVLSGEQARCLPLTNVHFHFGAEHKSEEYADATDSEAYDVTHRCGGRRLAADPRPGFMCSTAGLTQAQLAPHAFQHCRGAVEVGKSYEVHYVHSSAGYSAEDLAEVDADAIDDGLGGAANGRGILNPMIVVQAQVFQIVNGGDDFDDMLHGWTVVNHNSAVMYTGSTTGESHDNSVCSPYIITWHVDKTCHRVSPASFDNLCKQMRNLYELEADLYPHGSRKLVDPEYVVKAEFVQPLA